METHPTGTVTFLFTDVEGSTRRWELDPEGMSRATGFQDIVMRDVVAAHRGVVFKVVGDAYQAAFHSAPEALAATISAQRLLDATPEGTEPLPVRMALHTGAAELQGDDYVGVGLSRAPCLNRIARILGTGHGGQTLLSMATHQLVRDALPPKVELRDLGTHRLRDLQQPERIYQVVVEGEPASQRVFPPLVTLDSRPNNLPVQPTKFIGRERELADLERRILDDSARLVTLTGAGGTGKTRLALEAMAPVHDRFPDGAFVVYLNALRGSGEQAEEQLVAAIGQVVGTRMQQRGTPLESLIEDVRQKRMILLLDNFEHLLDARPVVSALLAACAHLKVVTTSREPLRIRAEWEFAVASLPMLDPERLPSIDEVKANPAISLFAERAQAVRRGFEVTPANVVAVASICQRLDGLPLAIELAASRVKLFPPATLLQRLNLDMLSRGALDGPEHHLSLRDTIAWSYDLLDPADQAIFRRLAVFAGGATLTAVLDVLGRAGGEEVDLDRVLSLVERSLVVLDSDRTGALDDEPRIALLQTVREFGLQLIEESGEAVALRQAHAAWYLDMAEQSHRELSGSAQALWLAKLEDDYGNVRAALDWALQEQDFAAVLRAGGALRQFWTRRGYLEEGRSLLDRAIELGTSVSTVERASALNELASIVCDLDDYPQARALHESALRIWLELGSDDGRGATLNNLGRVALSEGRYDEARACFLEALEIFEESGRTMGIAFARDNLGDVESAHGRFAAALALHESALRELRPLNDMANEAYSHHRIGTACLGLGEFDRARDSLERSLSAFRASGDRLGEGDAVQGLAMLARTQGNRDRALSLGREALALFAGVRDKLGMVVVLEGLAGTMVDEDPRLATESLAVAARQRDLMGTPCSPVRQAKVNSTSAEARTALGDAEFDEIRQLAGAFSLDDAVALVLRSEEHPVTTAS